MKILVTGAAGFVGSHLCETLLGKGYEVIGIDTIIGPTSADLKAVYLPSLLAHTRFQFVQEDLLHCDLNQLLEGVTYVFHLAAIPGVRSSWGKDFQPYVRNNIEATQRLLEVCRQSKLEKFIYVSTSSVYGEKVGEVTEEAMPTPLSPYGVTKLSGEHLCQVYHKNFGVPLVIVRYFTVYGPRQRPDMAFHRLTQQILQGKPLTIFGDGLQSRDFTYIDDCVKGTISTIETKQNVIGEVINIGGKERSSLLDIITTIENISGVQAVKHFSDAVPGEPKHTWASIAKARKLLQYEPVVSLEQGLREEFSYLKQIYGQV